MTAWNRLDLVVRCWVVVGLVLTSLGVDAATVEAASQVQGANLADTGLLQPVSPTPTPTELISSETPTLDGTPTPTEDRSLGPTPETPTPTPTMTATVTATLTVAPAPTSTITESPTTTPSATGESTSTGSPTPSQTPTETATASATVTPTETATTPRRVVPSVEPAIRDTQPLTDTLVVDVGKSGQLAAPGLGITISVPTGAFTVPVQISARGLGIDKLTEKHPTGVTLSVVVELKARMDIGQNGVPGADVKGTTPGLDAVASPTAVTGSAEELIEKFDRAIDLMIDITRIEAERGHPHQQIWVGYYDPKAKTWVAADYTTSQTVDGRTLALVQTDHFSTWGFGSHTSAGWVPVFSEPAVAEFSGAATYSYPIEVPAGRGGVQPPLALSYGSRAVDGLTVWSQGDFAGLGWDIGAPMITRDWSADGDTASCSQGIFRLQLGGAAYVLLKGERPNGAAYVRYYTQENSGLYIERHNRGLGGDNAPNDMGEYWIVRSPDGMTYRMGWTEASELIVHASPNCNRTDPTAEAYAGNVAGKNDAVAIMWRTDRHWDTHGNYVQYKYAEEAYCDWISSSQTNYHSYWEKASYLSLIQYNRDVAVSPNGQTGLPSDWNNAEPRWYNTEIAFDRANRGPIGGSQSDWLAGGCGSSGLSPEILHMNQYLTAIRVHQAGAMIRKYELTYEMQNNPTDGTRLLKTVTLRGKDGTYVLPTTTFSYVTKPNKSTRCGNGPNCGVDGNGNPIPNTDWDKEGFNQSRLYEVNNGYGGRTQLDYLADNDISSGNVRRAYRVSERRSFDGIHAAAARITYQYDGPCFRSSGAPVYVSGQPWYGYVGFLQSLTPRGCPNPAPLGQTFGLAGYAFVRTTVYDYNGSAISRVDHWFKTNEQDAKLTGRDSQIDTLAADASRIFTRQTFSWYMPGAVPGRPANVYPVRLQETVSQQCKGTPSAAVCYGSKTQYPFYDINENVLRVDEYGNSVDTTIYRSTVTDFYSPNLQNPVASNSALPNWVGTDKRVWLVSLPKLVTVWNNAPDWNQAANRLESKVLYYYDQRDGNGYPNGWGQNPIAGDLLLTATHDWTTNQASSWAVLSAFAWYDGFGNVVQERDGRSLGTNITWDTGIGRVYPVAMSNTAGLSMSAGYDFQLGKLTSITDENSQLTEYEFDSFGRLFRVYKPGNPKANGTPDVSYKYYDNNSNVAFIPSPALPLYVAETVRAPSGSFYAVRHFYDGLGREIQTHTALNATIATYYGGGQDIYVTNDYNAMGVVVRQTNPYPMNPLPGGSAANPYSGSIPADVRSTYTTYNAAGWPVTITDPAGGVTSHYYGVDDNGGNYNYQFANTNMWQHAVVDPNRHLVHTILDAFGRVHRIREFSGNSTPTYQKYSETTNQYGRHNELQTVWDGLGNATSITYNHAGQKTAMQDPDMGSWSYSYDLAGNIQRQMDARNQVTCTYYDAINRPQARAFYNSNVTCPGSIPTTARTVYNYDEFNPAAGQYGRGRMTSAYRYGNTNGNEVNNFWVFDSRGRLTAEKLGINSEILTTSYTYDESDRVRTITYPNGEVVTQSYDTARPGLQTGLSGWSSYVGGIGYTVFGRPAYMTFGSGEQAVYSYYGLHREWDTTVGGYTSYGRLASLGYERGNSTSGYLHFRYEYDAAGNVTTERIAPTGNYSWTGTTTFSDSFTAANTTNWTYSGQTSVSGGTLNNTGTGSNWNATVYRNPYSISNGKGIELRFQVSTTSGDSYHCLVADDAGTYRRVCAVVHGGRIMIQTYDNGYSNWPITLIYTAEVNTWYKLRMVVEDKTTAYLGRGIYVEVTQENNAAKAGFYAVDVAAGKNWRYQHWDWSGTSKVDDYKEFTVSGLGGYDREQRQTYTYDELNRLTAATYTYAGYNLAIGYNRIGNITSMTGSYANMPGSYTYNPSGSGSVRPHAVTSTTGGYSYTYDANGNVDNRNERGAIYDHNYNVENQLETVTVNGNTITFQYDAMGRLVKRSGRREVVWWEDSAPLGANMEACNPGGAYPNNVFSWDWGTVKSGGVAVRSGTAADFHQHCFTAPSNFGQPVRSGDKLVVWVYIPSGTTPNEILLQWNDPTLGWAHRAYWGAEYTGFGTPGTDAMRYIGPIPTARNAWVKLEVDASVVGMVGKTAVGVAYGFHQSAAGGTIYWDHTAIDHNEEIVYVNQFYEKNYSTGEGTAHYYVNGQQIAYRNNSGVYFMHNDGLGTSTLTTDAWSNMYGETRNTAFGHQYYVWGDMKTDLRYTGQRIDETLGSFYDYKARHYSPIIGRFLEADTIVPDPGNPQALNRYSYVYGRPTSLIDPSGHWADCPPGDSSCLWDSYGGYESNLTTYQLSLVQRQKLMGYHNRLTKQVAAGAISDLEAYARLSDAAAIQSAGCTRCYVENMGALLTGHTHGATAGELAHQAFGTSLAPEYEQLHNTGKEIGQTGFSPMFQDPNTTHGGGVQAHHHWFYVQAGYQEVGPVAVAGVIAHETVLTRNPAGNSYQDIALGMEGVGLGQGLSNGTISPGQVGNYLRQSLAPGSNTAFQWYLNQYTIRALDLTFGP